MWLRARCGRGRRSKPAQGRDGGAGGLRRERLDGYSFTGKLQDGKFTRFALLSERLF